MPRLRNNLLPIGAIVALVGCILAAIAVHGILFPSPLECASCQFDLHNRSASILLQNLTDQEVVVVAVRCRWRNQEITDPREYGYASQNDNMIPHPGIADVFMAHSKHYVSIAFQPPNTATTPKEIIFTYVIGQDASRRYELRCKPRLL